MVERLALNQKAAGSNPALRAYYRRMANCIAWLGGRCVVCGATVDLQIDHVDRSTKAFDIGTWWSLRWTTIVEELRKCQCLCRKHHQEKTLRELTGPREHGTWAAWRRAKCRCQVCRDFFNAYRRELRARARERCSITG
jgi:hypothetical protein